MNSDKFLYYWLVTNNLGELMIVNDPIKTKSNGFITISS